MRALISFVALLFGLSVLHPPDAAAISKRKQCRDACGAKIEACIAQGGKKKKCRRQTLKTCRRQGFETCVVTTTTTTISGASTTQVGATTTIAGGSTTTGPGGSTTTTPGQTTTTLGESVHGCSRANATNLKGEGSPAVSFADYQYVPRCILVSAGQTVTFSGAFGSHPLVGGTAVGAFKTPDPSSPIGTTNSGTSKPVQFTSAGTYPFYCDEHGLILAMAGAVFVDP